jgi:membrane protease YdiL (CAAX protease family)
VSSAGATPASGAVFDDLWRRSGWNDRVGGRRLNGFLAGILAFAIAWNLVANLWLPGAAWVPVNASLAVLLVVASRRAGMSFEELGLRRDRIGRGLLVGGVAFAAVLVFFAVVLVLPTTRELLDDEVIARASDTTRVFTILVRIPLGTVVFEEILFRSVLLGLALRRWSVRSAILVTAACFGLWHVVPASKSAGNGLAAFGSIVGTVAITTVAGVLFDWLRLRANSVVAPMLAHVATNSLAYLAVVIALRVR